MKKRIVTAALTGALLLTGCSSPEQKPDTSSSLVEQLVTSTSATPGTTTTPHEKESEPEEKSETSTTTTAAPVTTPEVTTTPNADSDFNIFYSEVNEQFLLSEDEKNFVEYSLFVGDSICSGFGAYGIVPWDYVAAKGSLGSRSFYDYKFSFRDKEEQTYAQVLKTAKPRYVFLSMGMNDVNMVYENTYCENYRKIIQETLDKSGADVFVAAITPVCSNFCDNSVIDSFNDEMKKFIAKEFPERVHFFDFGRYLKNDQNKLRTCLHSGDGIHLGPYCYNIALWEMHRALTEAGLWDGTAPTDGSKPNPPAQTEQITTAPEAPETREEPEEKPQTTKPEATTAKTTKPEATTAKTTKQTTAKTTKTKPAKTTASPKESTGEPTVIEIPVD